jgi:hypothetical protein
MKEILLTAFLLLPGNAQVAVSKSKNIKKEKVQVVCEVPKAKKTPKPCKPE